MDTKEPIASTTKAPTTRVGKAKSGASRAGRWNREMLNRLTVALMEDPEADMITFLTPMYSKKLRSLKQASSLPPDNHATRPAPPNHDIRARLHATDPSSVIFEPSAELKALLHEDLSLSESIVNLLADSEVLYAAVSIMVFKLNEALVVKVTGETSLTEHRSLAFLQENLPSFPAPRPHGLIRLGHRYLLFTTFIPGLDLEKVWPRLNRNQKQSVTDQLGVLFSQLRSLPHLASTPLGDVQGGNGCRDLRRDLRISTKPITTDKEFQDFIFSGSRSASPSYVNLLRGLMPESAAKIVFTHGDVRPANIIVKEGEDEKWQVASVIDWESSGFYPEYWECIKATNNLSLRDNTDWYQYLPDPISPGRYPTTWLVDRLWDRSMVNS